MCGIAGVLSLTGEPLVDSTVSLRMASTLQHRGPDDQGFYMEGPVAFGFQRLSIIDLDSGHQPLSNEDRSIWVMLNGEIFNYVELREQLIRQGHHFSTKSDTEVIAHAYEEHGIDFVHCLRGMFAIALWDSKQRRLILVRDRLGQKPLFYSVQSGELAFASELKAFTRWPHLQHAINPKALHDFLTFLYVPAPDSILEGVFKIPPAHMLVVDCGTPVPPPIRYWSALPQPDRTKERDYFAEGLREVLAEAVRIRLRSDVPLGAFLSGGIDSTIIIGLMTEMISPVRTFSISFTDGRFDEGPLARKTAAKFGTLHTEESVDASNFTPDQLVELVWFMDEPFGDSSFIPTFWVSKIARKHVTVALSGDGGDELFAGYNRYRHLLLLEKLQQVPPSFRSLGGGLAGLVGRSLPPSFGPLPERLRQVQKALRMSRLPRNERVLALVTYFDESEKHGLYTDAWRDQLGMYTSQERMNAQFSEIPLDSDADVLAWMMARDIGSNLTDDALVKVDRSSMACSLEVRSPFLDHRVVEFASRIPPEYKLHNGVTKAILKQAFAHLIPEHVASGKKRGFELPFAHWFQHDPWQSFLIDLISKDRLEQQGIFDARKVVSLRDAFLADPEAKRQRVSAYQLKHRVWMLLMFQIWYEHFMRSAASEASCVSW